MSNQRCVRTKITSRIYMYIIHIYICVCNTYIFLKNGLLLSILSVYLCIHNIFMLCNIHFIIIMMHLTFNNVNTCIIKRYKERRRVFAYWLCCNKRNEHLSVYGNNFEINVNSSLQHKKIQTMRSTNELTCVRTKV